MATGDIKNNLQKLVNELKGISYDITTIDFDALTHGIPSGFLPIIHYTFLDYSLDLASYLAKRNYELYARTDLRFVESVFKILMKEFSYKPNLKKEQFLALGFAERKIIFLTDLIKFCKEKTKTISSKKAKRLRNRKSFAQSKIANSSQAVVGIGASSSNQMYPVRLEESSDVKVQTIFDEEAKESVIATTNRLLSEATANLPIPYPDPYPLAEQISQSGNIPQPSDSLIITPIKDTKTVAEADFEYESVPRKSRADIIDIEDSGPKVFRVVSHLFDQDEAGLSQGSKPNFENKKDGRFNKAEDSIHPLTYLDTQDESEMNQKQDRSIKSNTYHTSPELSTCHCKGNESLVKELQEQVQFLSSSLKDVITINNDLSARVVLLETHCRLMKGNIEAILSKLHKESEEEAVGQITSAERQTSSMNQRGAQRQLSYVDHNIQKKKNYEYSPDKYQDADTSLPPDFQPLVIGNEDITSPFPKQKVRCKDDGKETNDHEKEDLLAPQEELQHSPIFNPSVGDRPALSPLNGSEFSFMEEGTKTTVRNLQKRLEETMNLFKLSSRISVVEDPAQTLTD